MVNQIIWYWLTFIFGVIAAGLTYLVTQYYKMWKELKDNAFQKELETLKKEMQEYTKETLKDTEESHKKLYNAVVDMYSRQFLADCDRYLALSRAITNEEYKNLYQDFQTYKSLGGNGLGQKMFEKIEEKSSDKQIAEETINAINAAKG